MTWSTISRHASTNYSGTLQNVPAHDILSLYKDNYILKIFERLPASLKRKNMSRRRALLMKMDLFNEYAHPKPFPKDMFLRLNEGSPDQAYVILGQRSTGKKFILALLVY